MNKENRESILGSMRTVPVSEGFRGRPMGGDKSEGAAGEDYKGLQKRSVVKIEGVVPHVARRCYVYDKDTL
jgi:hypothetical protein